MVNRKNTFVYSCLLLAFLYLGDKYGNEIITVLASGRPTTYCPAHEEVKRYYRQQIIETWQLSGEIDIEQNIEQTVTDFISRCTVFFHRSPDNIHESDEIAYLYTQYYKIDNLLADYELVYPKKSISGLRKNFNRTFQQFSQAVTGAKSETGTEVVVFESCGDKSNSLSGYEDGKEKFLSQIRLITSTRGIDEVSAILEYISEHKYFFDRELPEKKMRGGDIDLTLDQFAKNGGGDCAAFCAATREAFSERGYRSEKVSLRPITHTRFGHAVMAMPLDQYPYFGTSSIDKIENISLNGGIVIQFERAFWVFFDPQKKPTGSSGNLFTAQDFRIGGYDPNTVTIAGKVIDICEPLAQAMHHQSTLPVGE